MLLLFIFIFLLFIIDFLFYSFYFRVKFAQSPLNIKTFDGSNQPYHPSVLFFENGWNRYRYWMAETPYPINGKPYRDRWECPMIHVSNDGISWKQIDNKPIDDLNDSEIINKDFFSDPHLVFTHNRVECYYRISHRLTNGFHTYLLRKTTTDGKTWSERELIADFNCKETLATLGDMVRSHAIVFHEEKYMMWYVDNKDPNGYKNVCYSESIDGINWKKKQTCKLVEGNTIIPWHIDLTIINGKYILTIYNFQDLSIWEGKTETEFKFISTILQPSGIYGCFYSSGLYRSSLIHDNNEFKLYFSAFTDKSTYLGLMTGEKIDRLRVFNTKQLTIKIKDYPIFYYKNRKILLWNIKQRINQIYYDKRRT